MTDDGRLLNWVIGPEPSSVATKVDAPLSSRLSFSKSVDILLREIFAK